MTAGSLLATAATMGVVIDAFAAPAQNPWTTVTVTEMTDGTGHGTSAATFVNTANGFYPGDDGPKDGVVSSHDIVTYMLDVQFKASVARTVTFTFGAGSHLEWLETGDLFCRSGHFVKATRSGNSCTFEVPAGAVEQFAAPLVLRAKDTGGLAIPDQRLTIDTSANGTGVYSTTISAPVTVVSAPASDVYVTANESFDQSQWLPYPSRRWTTDPQDGYFMATPLALQYPGYSPTKGVSTEGKWWGTFDVSSFPEGTTYLVAGVPQTPVNGLLTIPPSSGIVQIDYTVPGWPAARPGGGECADPAIDEETGEVAPGCWGANESHYFQVRVNVDPASFSTDGGLVNNGGKPGNRDVGWQPGDGDSADQTTANDTIGSLAGRPYPNNDWAAVRVIRDWTKTRTEGDLPLVYKRIFAPTNLTRTVWDERNKTAASGSELDQRDCSELSDNCMGAAPETELTSVISATTGDLIWNNTGDPATPAGNPENGKPVDLERLIFGDTWDNREQWLDLTRELTMSESMTQVGEPGGPVIQWSAATKSPAQIADLNDTGWTTGWPTDPQVAATVRSLRVIVEATEDAPFPPHTQYVIRIPLRLADQDALAAYAAERGMQPSPETAYDGRRVRNTASLYAVANGQEARSTYARNIVVRLPRPALVEIDHTSAPQSPTVGGFAPVGSPIDFTIESTVRNIADTSSSVVHPEVVVELDKCLLTPVNTSSVWKMEITPAVRGTDGRVCGSTDPDARGAILTFTPATGDTVPVTWTDRAWGTGTLPEITYTAVPALSMRSGARVTSGATITLDPELDNVPLPASDDTYQDVAARENNAAALSADFKKTEIDEPLSWTWEVFSANPLVSGQQNSTVLILPHMGDGQIYTDSVNNDLYNPEGYEEMGRAQESSFHGSYTVAEIGFSVDDTSARAVLYYTTDPITELDPGATSNWFRVDTATPAELATARAIKVDMTPGSSDETSTAKVHITLQPDGNKRDDVYVLWPSQTDPTDEFGSGSTGGEIGLVPAPYPDDIRVVTSTITGTVWWDPDWNGRIGAGEEGIEDVEVTLHRANADGTPGQLMGSTTTDENGFYRFELLHSGAYVTVVHRGQAIPANVTTRYGATRDIEQTYSYKNNFSGNAKETSSVINLGIDAVQPDVDFGFHKPDPNVALDKSEAQVSCDDGLCTVVWDVTITNLGNEPITDGVLYDRLSKDAVSVEVRGVRYDPVRATGLWGTGRHQLMTASDGTLWSWGYNQYNWMLGDGTDVDYRATPGQPKHLDGKTITAAAGGDSHSLAVDSDGTVWAWGRNFQGELGDGTNAVDRPTPVQVVGLEGKTIIDVAVGMYHSVALASDGTVWAWGYNEWGQLGNGTMSDFYDVNHTPVQVLGLEGKTITAVAAGAEFSMALADDGTVWSWGYNGQRGYLGDGTKVHRSTAVQVVGLDGKRITALSCGVDHTLALADDGTVWAWGDNFWYQLGDGTSTIRLAPVQVLGLEGKTITAVSAGGEFSMVLADDGTLWGWGVNTSGQLGDGTTISPRRSPVQALGLDGKTITSVHATSMHTAVIADDGTVWGWGSNSKGQLGIGSVSPQELAPVQALDLGRKEMIVGAVHNPVSVAEAGGLVTRGYALQTLVPGEARSFQVTATYLRPSSDDGDKVVVNQAWVDSSLTPYKGLHGQPEPNPAVVPSPEDMDPKGVPGNTTCDTNADPDDLQGDPSVDEDSCDQVPGKLSPLPTKAGALSGVAWVDTTRDGLRANDEPLLPGVTVALYRDGVLYGETVTDEDGAYIFEGLPPGGGYTVQFGVSHLDTGDGTTYAFVAANVGTPEDDVWDAPESRDSDADQSTGLTVQQFIVTAGKTTGHVDVGVEVYGPEISVVKTSELGDDVVMEVPAGERSDPLSVFFTFTNIGDEPLINIEWVDETVEGPEVQDFVCVPALEGLVLAPSESVTCTGTLPEMEIGETHTDTVEVTANGQFTGRNVKADDPFTARVDEKWVAPVIPLPPTGGQRDVIGLGAGMLALALLIGLAAHRGMRLSPQGVGGTPRHVRSAVRRVPRGRRTGD